MHYYCQCELQKDDKHMVSWIPERYAIQGRILKLKNDNGWKVMSVGVKLSAEELEGKVKMA